MFGPFATPYLYALGRQRSMGGAPQIDLQAQLQQAQDQQPQSFDFMGSSGLPAEAAGFGGGLGFGGADSSSFSLEPDADARRRARNAGLMALGTSLLGASSSGDIAGGIAHGLAGFQAARESALDRDLKQRQALAEERRRQNDDARATSAERRALAAEQDRDSRAALEDEAARLSLDHTREDRTRLTRSRESTATAAARMAAEIDAVAAADPSDATLQRMAKEAAAYNRGEDSDLDRLTALHSALTQRAGSEDNFMRDTQRDARRVQEQSKLGYGPIAESRRANENLALERERLGIYRVEAGRRAENAAERGSTTSTVKPATWYDDVDKELNKLVDAAVKERAKSAGEVDTQKMLSTAYVAEERRRKAAGLPSQGIPYIQSVSPDEINDIRRKYEPTAISNVDRIYGVRSGSGSASSNGKTSAANSPIASRPGSPARPVRTEDQSRANHIRNAAVDALMKGGSPEEGLTTLRDLASRSGGTLWGFTPEQYLENAKRRARQLGWNGR